MRALSLIPLLALLLLAGSAGGVAAQAAPDSAGDALTQATELLREGEYDRAIEILRRDLPLAAGDRLRQRDLYLQLIKTYVFLGNDFKFRPQGREASNLNYQEAKRLIAECLTIPELRHTRPLPAAAFPPEMITFFDEARHSRFGAFRVRERFPADALVLLDGDTLGVLPGTAEIGDTVLTVGPHRVTVRAPGFRERFEIITIAPHVTLERSYVLTRRRGGWWYATRGALVAGLVGGLAAWIGGGEAGASTPPPLAGPPDPPAVP